MRVKTARSIWTTLTGGTLAAVLIVTLSGPEPASSAAMLPSPEPAAQPMDITPLIHDQDKDQLGEPALYLREVGRARILLQAI